MGNQVLLVPMMSYQAHHQGVAPKGMARTLAAPLAVAALKAHLADKATAKGEQAQVTAAARKPAGQGVKSGRRVPVMPRLQAVVVPVGAPVIRVAQLGGTERKRSIRKQG